MPLSDHHKAVLAEAARESFAVVDNAASALNAEVVNLLIDDADLWETLRDKHLRLAGGSDGLDVDYERNRDAVRRRIRKRLGLPLYSEEELQYSTGAMQLVELDLSPNYS